MKFLIVLALAVAVSAEADPWMVYNTAGLYAPSVYHHAYTPYHYKPAVYHANSPGVSHTVGLHKREAEPYHHIAYPYAATTYAHSWAAPSVYAAHAYAPYGVKSPLYSNDAVSPYGYAAKGQYVAKSGPVTHIAKREAEPYYYGAYPYAATTYAHHYATPYVHAATPYVHATPYVSGMKTYQNHAAQPWNYAAKGMYHADSLGAKHVAKREAEPYFYGAYGYGSSAYPFVSHASPAVYAHSHPLRVNAYVKHF